MEKRKKKRKNEQSLFRQHWPIIVAIMLLVGTVNCFAWMYDAFSAGPTVNLHFLESQASMFITLVCIIVPVIHFTSVGIIICRKRFGIVMILSDLGAIGLIALSLLMTWGFIGLGDPLPSIKDRLASDNHIFALVSKNTYDDLGYGRFVLYQCDKQGFHCNQVYESDWGYYTADPASLNYDAETLSISVTVKGKKIHSHPIES